MDQARFEPRRATSFYHLHPLLLGPAAGWGAELDRIAALGVEGIVLAPPFAPGSAGDVFLACDHDRVHPVLADGAGAAEALLGAACRAAEERGLALLLDLVIGRVPADGVLAAQHPQWFAAAGAAHGPDPRFAPSERSILRPRWEEEGLLRWWEARLRGWVELGVAGFRCDAPGEVPAATWRRLIASVRALRDTRFIAWTPGMPQPQVAALGGAGFSFVCSSAAWWDFRAGWLAEEHTALRQVAPLLAFPEAPFGPRLAAAHDEPGMAALAARRALRFCAGFGDALLLPMGFEFGARRALDPVRDRPGDWHWLRDNPGFDLGAEITAATAMMRELAPLAAAEARPLAGPGAPAAALLREASRAEGRKAVLILANPELDAAVTVAPEALLPAAGGDTASFRALGAGEAELIPGRPLTLERGEVRVLAPVPQPPVLAPAAAESVTRALEAPRIAIEAVAPTVDAGRFPVKRVIGETVTVEADIFADGHAQLAAALLWRPADERDWRRAPMRKQINDRWAASFPLERLGRHLFAVEAWWDVFGSWREEVEKKHAAQVPIALELEEGLQLVAAAAKRGSAARAGLGKLAERLRDAAEGERLSLLLAPETARMMAAADEKSHRVETPAAMPVDAERSAAQFASWYEIFPRSQSDDPRRHGTFDDVIRRLPAIRAMGFDVLYFPPIHPIGRVNRKGRNNSLKAAPDDPGSPYAIGAAEGGHDALHPELGTLEDFRRLVAEAAVHGLEIAIDFAIQCAPDHPWLKQHPGWFDWRPDGSLKYAENPPKKYEDIVNVDFYAAGAMPSLWIALRDVVQFWVDHGVRCFRVDNPHTKPFPFWEWLIADIRGRHPDAIFLSEAFTRPKVMYRLAKLGFSQSYTYFTWRNQKQELQDYLVELTTTAPRDFFRPHFFVNTPDINPVFLQTGGRPAHLIRAALAATLSGLWGVYNGFELCEATPLPGREEYLDSEKYQIRIWDHDRPGNITAEITRLNMIRRANPALHSHLGLAFLNAFDDRVIYYRKATPDHSNVILVAVNLDPHHAADASFEIPLWEWGLPDHAALEAEDLMRGHRFTWQGKLQHVRLDPADLPFAIWRVSPCGRQA